VLVLQAVLYSRRRLSYVDVAGRKHARRYLFSGVLVARQVDGVVNSGSVLPSFFRTYSKYSFVCTAC